MSPGELDKCELDVVEEARRQCVMRWRRSELNYGDVADEIATCPVQQLLDTVEYVEMALQAYQIARMAEAQQSRE